MLVKSEETKKKIEAKDSNEVVTLDIDLTDNKQENIEEVKENTNQENDDEKIKEAIEKQKWTNQRLWHCILQTQQTEWIL